jgi:hypothetical protein
VAGAAAVETEGGAIDHDGSAADAEAELGPRARLIGDAALPGIRIDARRAVLRLDALPPSRAQSWKLTRPV